MEEANYIRLDDYNAEENTNFLWENVTFEVSRESDSFLRKFWKKIQNRPQVEPIKILNGVYGYARNGNMVAVMGPSGAGKTTLLAALAGKIELTSGSMEINGITVSKETMSEVSSLMPQFDALPASLTAKEYMTFMCALKLNERHSEKRKIYTEKILSDLGLLECKDRLIQNLSGGQRKKLSIATELITKPKILFLDEPTTGLDTFAAVQVIQTLKLITLGETIVFCTIHQPGMAIYNLFSHVLLMSEGKTAYFGTTENATEFFKREGFECPASFDESEYYINILSGRYLRNDGINWDDKPPTNDRAASICEAFAKSSFSKIPTFQDCGAIKMTIQKRSNFSTQLYWLLWRTCKQSKRTMFSNWLEWLSYLISVLVVGFFYTGVNPYTQAGVQDARGALYLMTCEIVFSIAYSVVYEIPGEIVIFLREKSIYGSVSYYVSVIVGLIPKALVKALFFTAVVYLILNPQIDFYSFAFYCVCIIPTAISGIAYGTIISSWIKNIDIATTIMVPIDLVLLSTAGIFYNLRTFPFYLACFKYFSVFYYVNEALSIIFWPQINKIECDSKSELPCLSNGNEVLDEYGYNKSSFWWNLCYLTLLTFVMNFISYLGVRRRRLIQAIY